MTSRQVPTLKLGSIVGKHYEIKKLLGVGGFGETYLAIDNSVPGTRECAVKYFKFTSPRLDEFAKALELFHRESAVLYELNNSSTNNYNIPRFFAAFNENKHFFLVQEFIEGCTLRKKLKQNNKLQEEQVSALLKKSLQVLEFLHKKKIIHRDIKPDNIMLRNSDDSIVFIDFGAVKEVIAQSTNSQSSNQSTLIYSGGYTPVEQFKRKTQFNSDIYALGMTALEALTGENPAQLKRDNNRKVILPQQLQVSKELVIILQGMVDEDYQKRYKSAKDVLDALRECRNTSPVSNHVPTIKLPTVSQPTKWVESLPKWLKIATLMSLIIAIVSPVGFVINKVILPPEPGTTPSTTNPPGADNISPIRFIRAQPRSTPTSPLVEPLSTPSLTKDSKTESPIRFKRAKPNKILPSP